MFFYFPPNQQPALSVRKAIAENHEAPRIAQAPRYLFLSATKKRDTPLSVTQRKREDSFIGAGVILKDGLTVRGLTTAACLWLAAAIGMGFGMGLYLPTVISTMIGLCALIFLKRLEPYINKDRYLTFRIEVDEGVDIYPQLEEIFSQFNMIVTDISCRLHPRTGESQYKFVLTQHRQRRGRELAQKVATLHGVKKIEYR